MQTVCLSVFSEFDKYHQQHNTPQHRRQQPSQTCVCVNPSSRKMTAKPSKIAKVARYLKTKVSVFDMIIDTAIGHLLKKNVPHNRQQVKLCVFVHWHFNWFSAVIRLRWQRCNARDNHFRTECHNNTLYVCECVCVNTRFVLLRCAVRERANEPAAPNRKCEYSKRKLGMDVSSRCSVTASRC